MIIRNNDGTTNTDPRQHKKFCFYIDLSRVDMCADGFPTDTDGVIGVTITVGTIEQIDGVL